ncbi:MAG: hypothetical protein ABFD92_19075 [Planctomycetaceae bacterium]|nr:hypothetical protein [Planctomycetaceae bacterium]
MIRYKCIRCRYPIESEDSLIGQTDKCPHCGHFQTVPAPSQKKRFLKGYDLVLGGVILGFLVVVLYGVKSHQSWGERNNERLISMKRQADEALRRGENAQAKQTYEKLVAFVGDHALTDLKQKEIIAQARKAIDAIAAAEVTRIRLQKEQQDREAERVRADAERVRQREQETKAQLDKLRGEMLALARSKAKQPTVVSINLGRGIIKVHAEYTTLWLPEGGLREADMLTETWPSALWIAVLHIKDGSLVHDTHNFYEVDGKACELTVAVEGSSISFDRDSRYNIHAIKMGQSTVIYSIAGSTLRLPVLVAELPVRLEMSTKEVIEKLGLPDIKKDVSPPVIRGYKLKDYEAWQYRQYPGAVIEIVDDKVRSVTNTSPAE